jgi:hypothetical protein
MRKAGFHFMGIGFSCMTPRTPSIQ